MNYSTPSLFEKLLLQEIKSTRQTELHFAAGRDNLAEVKRLLSEGADVNALDITKQTPLHYLTASNINSDNFSISELLLKHGAKVNARDHKGNTPLHNLVSYDNGRLTQLFLDFEAQVNVRNHKCETPLFNAIRNDNVRVMEMLLDHGANVNEDMLLWPTPLHAAVESRDLKVIKCLYRRGVNVSNIKGQKALVRILRESNLPNLSKFLVKYTDISIMSQALQLQLFKRPPNESSWKDVVKHIAKMEALGVELPQSVLKVVLYSEVHEYKTYFKNCREELGVLKSTKIEGCWVTCFDLLVDNKRKLKNYAGNEDLVEGFRKIDCLRIFPIYGAEIKKNVEKGIQRRKFFDQSAEVLSRSLKIFGPTHLVVRDVLDCLNLKDYVRLTSGQQSEK